MVSRKAASTQHPPTPTTPPPTIIQPSSSIESSPCSSIFDDSDYESGDDFSSVTTMSHESLPPTRGLTVSIPQDQYRAGGSHCRRPNLSEILANTAPPPWSLSAFMAYLSQNHCLETLEFTMDASRYRKHYEKMEARMGDGASASGSSPGSEERTYVRNLWLRLLDAYIAPNAPREVNLPSDVRDRILELGDPLSEIPPHPNSLDVAVSKMYELMEESVLLPFLNSMAPPENLDAAHHIDETIMETDSHRSSHHSHSHSSSHGFLSKRTSRRGTPHSHFSRPNPNTASSSTSAGLTDITMADDSGSGSGSINNDWASPAASLSPASDIITPPTTPPTSEYGGLGIPANTPSPRNSRVDTSGVSWSPIPPAPPSNLSPSTSNLGSAPWRKVGHKLGFMKSRNHVSRDDEDMGGI
jgi:hypothetical protein